MTTLHPEVAELLATFAALELPDFADMSVAEARGLLASLKADDEALPPIQSQVDRTIPGPAGDLAIRIYRPSDATDLPALVWFHGGGWVLGDINSGDVPGRDLANLASCVVISVDYRLAPEAPFPEPFDDCMAATQWVADNSGELGIDASRIAVGGDSAGGNLAACVAVEAAARDLGLAHQLLVYPVIADDLDTESYRENGEGYFLTTGAMRWFWDHYTDPSQRSDPRVAPANGDVSSVASAWVFTAGFDPLRDEGQWYADTLDAAGVAVDRMHDPAAIHGVFGMTIACGEAARKDAAASLSAAFQRAT